MEKQNIIIVIAVFLTAAIVLVVASLSDKEELPEFCLTTKPTYLLSCQLGNETVSATSNQENLQKALQNNNCSVVDEYHQIDIVYCYQKVNGSKYKITIAPFED